MLLRLFCPLLYTRYWPGEAVGHLGRIKVVGENGRKCQVISFAVEDEDAGPVEGGEFGDQPKRAVILPLGWLRQVFFRIMTFAVAWV